MATFQETNRQDNKTSKNERLDRKNGPSIKRSTSKVNQRPSLYEPSEAYKASVRNIKVPFDDDDDLRQPSDSYKTEIRGISCGPKRSSMSSTTTTASTRTDGAGDGFFSDMLVNFPYEDDDERYYMTQ